MKRAIATLSILCGGLLAINPVSDIVFAQNTNNSSTIEIVSDIKEDNTEEVLNKEEVTTEQEIEDIEVRDILSQEEAKQLLENHNSNADYTYQGDETDFQVLEEKRLSGYIFLPDYETDLGLFVEENTGDIYYFHPSGYMNLI